MEWTVACILKELCSDKQHYTVIVAPEHQRFHPSTGALKADTGHIKAH